MLILLLYELYTALKSEDEKLRVITYASVFVVVCENEAFHLFTALTEWFTFTHKHVLACVVCIV